MHNSQVQKYVLTQIIVTKIRMCDGYIYIHNARSESVTKSVSDANV